MTITMFPKKNIFIIVLVQLSFASRGHLVEITDGDLHATGSTAMFTATANVPSSAYDFQWRFNGTAECRVFIFGGSVVEEKCDLATTMYSGHTSVSGVLSGSSLTTELTYTDILYEESVVVVSLHDVTAGLDIGTPGNLKVQNCTESSSGYNDDFVYPTPSCEYNCTSPIECPEAEGQEGDSVAVCESDASWNHNYTCTITPTTTGIPLETTNGTTESTGNSTIIDPISAGYDSSTSAQTEGGNKTGATDRMSEGDIAGTVLTCIFILECICLCVFVFALNYDLSLKLIIGLYVAGICLSIIGIFMSFFGSSTAGTVMNSVEIAGTVLGSVGITVMLGGIVMQALKGVGSKE